MNLYPITKEAWARVHQKACDIANASLMEDEIMGRVQTMGMKEVLDELEEKFGVHPAILATRADYVDDPAERLRLFTEALALARENGDEFEVEEILDSLRDLDEEG